MSSVIKNNMLQSQNLLGKFFAVANEAVNKKKDKNEGAGEDTVIRLSTDGKERTVEICSNDKIKKGLGVFYSRKEVDCEANNNTRNAFLDAVLGVLGKEKREDLPQNVRKALELGNFNNGGHPLSARRIRAVIDAVNKEIEGQGKNPISAPESTDVQPEVVSEPEPQVLQTDTITRAEASQKIVEFLDKEENLVEAKGKDFNLKVSSEYKVEGPDDTSHACKDNPFMVKNGGSSSVTSEIYRENHDAKICTQVFADATYFLCGVSDGWTTQEESTARDADPETFAHVIGNKYAGVNTFKGHIRRYPYATDENGIPKLSPADGYMIKGKLNRAQLKKNDNPVQTDFLFSAAPTLSSSCNADYEGTIRYIEKYLESVKGMNLDGRRKGLRDTAAYFFRYFNLAIDQKHKGETRIPSDKIGDAMMLVTFAAINDKFNVFGKSPEEQVRKLAALFTDAGAKECGKLLAEAKKNYENIMRQTVRTWIVMARERGNTHFVGGAIGCGAFANDPQTIAKIVAEEFVRHGGKMKYVFPKFSTIDPHAGIFEAAFKTAYENLKKE